MAFLISILLVATVAGCHVVCDAAGVQFNPMFMVAHPSPLLNHFTPYYYYGGQQQQQTVMVPTASAAAQDEMEPEWSEDDWEVTARQSSDTITISPVATACLRADVSTNGYDGCVKGSRAPSGTLKARLAAANQVVFFALVPNQKRYSKLKITCADVTAATVYTNTATITAPANTPVTEAKQTQVVIVSRDVATVTCSWEAS